MTKAQLTKLTILWGEAGLDALRGDYGSWDEANKALASYEAPEMGYDKVAFIVTFDNGDEYEGRLDYSVTERHFNQHIYNHMSFHANIRHVRHLTQAQQLDYITNFGKNPEWVDEAKQWLDTHDLGL